MNRQPAGGHGLNLVLLALLTATSLAGCASTGVSLEALPNPKVADLEADDIVAVMKRAGFSEEQILEHGTELRNALATSGAAQIRIGDYVEAMFAVSGRYLHITTRLRGSFVYDLQTRRFL